MASFSVVTNISAVNAQANLATTNIGLNKTLTRLSSGLRINQSGDDAAGLAVANALPFDRRGADAGRPQRQRRSVDAPDQGRRAQQHLDAARPSRPRWRRSRRRPARPSTATTLNAEFQDVIAEIDREANVAGLTTSARLLGVRQQRRRERHRRRHDRRGRCHDGLGVNALAVDDGGGRGDGGGDDRDRDRDARHGAGDGRHA